jgi:hypothetical protein
MKNKKPAQEHPHTTMGGLDLQLAGADSSNVSGFVMLLPSTRIS